MCKIEECDGKVNAWCLCAKHYQRLKRTGTTDIRPVSLKHGMSGSPEYNVWVNIKARCLNKKNTAYENYGGRGIKICDDWKNDFRLFSRDMGQRPFAGAQIDRIDNNGNYEPGNCRWATGTINARNTRRNILNVWMVKTIREMHERKIPRVMTCRAFGIRRDVYRLVIKRLEWRNV